MIPILDWIFEGIVGWVSSIASQLMDAVSGLFLEALGTDMTAMEEYFPFVTKAYSVMQVTAYAILILIVVWQLFRSFGGPITEAENPWHLLIRGAIFAFLVGYAKPIFNACLIIAKAPYTSLMELSMTGDDFTFAGIEQALTNGLTTLVSVASVVGLILILILEIALGWNYFKLLLETVERYIVVGVLCYTSPLAFSMGASKSTNNVFKSWCRMVGSQLLLLVMNVWFLRGFASSMGQFIGNGGALTTGKGSIFLWMFCALAYLKCAQRFDSYLASMGLNVAQTGSSMGMELMMAARVISGVGSGARSAGSVFGRAGGGATPTGAGAAGSSFAAGFASRFSPNSYVRDAVVEGGTRMGFSGGAGFVGRAFGGMAARNGATLNGQSISSVASRAPGVSGTIAGDIADRSLSNYMPHMAGFQMKDTQISGGRISTTATTPDGKKANVDMYSASQFEKPDAPHSVVTAADGSQWYQMASGEGRGAFYDAPTFHGAAADVPAGGAAAENPAGGVNLNPNQESPISGGTVTEASDGAAPAVSDFPGNSEGGIPGPLPDGTEAPFGADGQIPGGDQFMDAGGLENGQMQMAPGAPGTIPGGPESAEGQMDLSQNGSNIVGAQEGMSGLGSLPVSEYAGGDSQNLGVTAEAPAHMAVSGSEMALGDNDGVAIGDQSGNAIVGPGGIEVGIPVGGPSEIPENAGNSGIAEGVIPNLGVSGDGFHAEESAGGGIVSEGGIVAQGSAVSSDVVSNEPQITSGYAPEGAGIAQFGQPSAEVSTDGFHNTGEYSPDAGGMPPISIVTPGMSGDPSLAGNDYAPDGGNALQGGIIPEAASVNGHGGVEYSSENGAIAQMGSAPAEGHEAEHLYGTEYLGTLSGPVNYGGGLAEMPADVSKIGTDYAPTEGTDRFGSHFAGGPGNFHSDGYSGENGYGASHPGSHEGSQGDSHDAGHHGAYSEAPLVAATFPSAQECTMLRTIGDGVIEANSPNGGNTLWYNSAYYQEPDAPHSIMESASGVQWYAMQQQGSAPHFEQGEEAQSYNQAAFQQFMPGYDTKVSRVDGEHRQDGHFEVRHVDGSGTKFYDVARYAAPRGDYQVFEDARGSQWYAIRGEAAVERKPVYEDGKPVYDGDRLKTVSVETVRYKSIPSRFAEPEKRRDIDRKPPRRKNP